MSVRGTLVTPLSTLRVFVRWYESIDARQEGLSEEILLPSVSKNEDRRTAVLDADEGDGIIEYLRQFEFASRTHALVEADNSIEPRLPITVAYSRGQFSNSAPRALTSDIS